MRDTDLIGDDSLRHWMDAAPFIAVSVLSFGIIVLALHSQYQRGLLRFSLRNLLIATTLVAVVLGLIVWLGAP